MPATDTSGALLVAVDLGNTAMRLAAFRGERLEGVTVRSSKRLHAADVSGAWRELAQTVPDLDRARRVVIADVAAGAEAIAEALEELHPGIRGEVRTLAVTETSPLPHALETPETTGIDRLLAARAARELYAPRGRPLVVVQAGTALTVDSVDAAGVFRGGLILPGPELWIRGLGKAARIPLFNPDEVDWRLGEAAAAETRGEGPSFAGASTREAVLKGLATGLGAALRESVRRSLHRADTETAVVVTGGWAERAARLLADAAVPDPQIAPHLVLHGIRLAADDPAD